MAVLPFTTQAHESFYMKLVRWRFNYFPAYRRGGGRICFISDSWQEVQIKISLSCFTRNYVGSVFGGSLYSAIDPIYMLQLLKILGKNYIIWDKFATIKFIRPVKSTVFARFLLSDELLATIREEVKQNGKYVIDLPVSLEADGVIFATATKQLYIADKAYYKERQRLKTNS